MAEPVHLHAVVRLDLFHLKAGHPPEDPIWITVKEVLPTAAEAEAEVARLNLANADKDCLYFSAITRYYPEGRSASW